MIIYCLSDFKFSKIVDDFVATLIFYGFGIALGGAELINAFYLEYINDICNVLLDIFIDRMGKFEKNTYVFWNPVGRTIGKGLENISQ